jgi:sulfite exporter TauE/SafE
LCILPVQHVQLGAVVLVAGAALWQGVRVLRRGRAARAADKPIKLRRRGPSLWSRVLARVPRRGLGLGLVTGFLPCGMLVPAWLLAASTAAPLAGAAVMTAFAFASLPGLLLPVAGRRLVSRAVERVPAQVQGLAWCLLAAWIALRPLLAAVHHHH